MPSDGPMKHLGFIAFASLIEMWHASVLCDKDAYCEGMIAYAVAAGAIPLILCLIFALVAQLQAYIKYLSAFLAVWWLCVLLALTMPGTRTDCKKDTYCNGVFVIVNNGFLGCWAALFFSCLLMGETMGVGVPDLGMGGGGGEGGEGSTDKPPGYPDDAHQHPGAAGHASQEPVV